MKFTAEAGAKRRKTHYPKAPLNIQRQVVLTENRNLLAFLPPEVTRNAVLAYDPLPPPDAP